MSMKWLGKILKLLTGLLFVGVCVLYITGNSYILKGVRVVYLTGHKSAFIDDTKYFKTRTIEKGETKAWNLHKNYNKIKPTSLLKKTNQNLGTTSFLIIKNDSIWHEYYAEGYDENSLTNSFSMAKSITTALLFKAIDDGYIPSLQTKVKSILPQIEGPYANELTVGDLSSMASGLNWEESYTSPFSMTAQAYYDDNIRDLILGLKVNDKPGKKYKYLSGATQLLGMVLEQATKKTNTQYLTESFWKPMGMRSNALWQIDGEESGLEKTYCCVASNARDFARFGQLWQHNGNWGGAQLISEKMAKLAKKARFLESPEYGYGLWLSDYMGKKISYMRGILGQYVICIPEDNLMIVRLGHKRMSVKEGDSHPQDFKIYIDEVYKMLGQEK